MNNKEFIAELARRNDISVTEAQHMMNTLLATMGDSFMEGESVQLPNFGLFEVKKKMERIIINPTTGQRMLVPPKLTVAFKPTSVLKDKLKNGGE